MTAKKIQLRSIRVFTEEFKKTCVREYETGQFTVVELSQLYKIQRIILYRWIHRYSTYNKKRVKVVEMADSSKKRLKEMQDRIQELERIVGQKQLNIDFLEKMIELARNEYGIDIKKNSSTPRSTGSEKTSGK